MADINPQYLDKIYEDIHRETLNLMNKMKNHNPTEPDIEKDIIKQISIYNILMVNILKLKNIKVKLVLKNIA
jgi:hypothetical protein